ncbi:MAG: ATPase, T2SS/T4P/T4SS family, partial [Candidatus Omnitrophica bacterium]|nr:ATPase, T2SS/T4P/T4SS family [Candidatus Omnitrophota bacterium]
MAKEQIKLGEILIKEGLITTQQLEEALTDQKSGGQRRAIGEVLVAKGFISEENLALALSKKLNLPFLSFAGGTLKMSQAPEIKAVVPELFARQNMILPYSKTASTIHVACSDPQNILMLDDLKLMTRLEAIPAVATISDILKGLDELYGKEDLYKKTIATAEAAGPAAGIKSAGQNAMEGIDEINIDQMRKTAEEAPLIKLVDLIIMEAISNKASDIHIEPFENKLSIRYRIDGILYEIPPPAKQLSLSLVSRIKILARMDISEKRLPQDGGFMVRMKDKVVDLRVSTMPTIYGEKVVIRILDKTAMTADLGRIGFESGVLAQFKKALAKPNGLIFITGPTGSGKSTTLYAALNELRTPKKNIVTIEDPVEYRLEGVNQVQIKPQIGLTFAAGVRSFLRQDPD